MDPTVAIDAEYERVCRSPSDIKDHLPVIRTYAQGLRHVTEFGVRTVVSTWALLAARPQRVVSIDIEDCPVSHVAQVASAAGINFQFSKADTLVCEIEKTELLFIDSWHTYAHVLSELLLHAPKVGQYILLHDTDTNWPKSGHPGMKEGVEEFVRLNSDWQVEKVYTGCHGLTVLRRVGRAHDSDVHTSLRAELQKTIEHERLLCRDMHTWNHYLALEKDRLRGKASPWSGRLFHSAARLVGFRSFT